MSKIKRIIKEEISMGDVWYSKNIVTQPSKTDLNIHADDKVGIMMNNIRGVKLKNPVWIIKNPKTLKGIELETKGILLRNGDFYIMDSSLDTLHDDLVRFLLEKNILPPNTSENYPRDLPEEYVAVDRVSDGRFFLPSSLYEKIPTYYKEMFEMANKKGRPYRFILPLKGHDDVDEQLDMNRAYSFHPKGLDPNRNFGRPF